MFTEDKCYNTFMEKTSEKRSINIDENTHQELKILAAIQKKKINALTREIIREYIKSYETERSA